MMRRALTTLALAALLPLAACAGEEKSTSNDNGPGEAGTAGGTPGAPAQGAPEAQAAGVGQTAVVGATTVAAPASAQTTSPGTAHQPGADSTHTKKP